MKLLIHDFHIARVMIDNLNYIMLVKLLIKDRAIRTVWILN